MYNALLAQLFSTLINDLCTPKNRELKFLTAFFRIWSFQRYSSYLIFNKTIFNFWTPKWLHFFNHAVYRSLICPTVFFFLYLQLTLIRTFVLGYHWHCHKYKISVNKTFKFWNFKRCSTRGKNYLFWINQNHNNFKVRYALQFRTHLSLLTAFIWASQMNLLTLKN